MCGMLLHVRFCRDSISTLGSAAKAQMEGLIYEARLWVVQPHLWGHWQSFALESHYQRGGSDRAFGPQHSSL